MVSLSEARHLILGWLAYKNYPTSISEIQYLSNVVDAENAKEVKESRDRKQRLTNLTLFKGFLMYGFDEFRQTADGQNCEQLVQSIRHRIFVTRLNLKKKLERGVGHGSIYEDPIWKFIEQKILQDFLRLWNQELFTTKREEILAELYRYGI